MDYCNSLSQLVDAAQKLADKFSEFFKLLANPFIFGQRFRKSFESPSRRLKMLKPVNSQICTLFQSLELKVEGFWRSEGCWRILQGIWRILHIFQRNLKDFEGISKEFEGFWTLLEGFQRNLKDLQRILLDFEGFYCFEGYINFEGLWQSLESLILNRPSALKNNRKTTAILQLSEPGGFRHL